MCTDVNIDPTGAVSAKDYCTEVVATKTYTCPVLLVAAPDNPIPARWEAATTGVGGVVSITFSPPNGMLAVDGSVSIVMTIVDPQCPVDTVVFTFYDPETPGLPQDHNRLTWVC